VIPEIRVIYGGAQDAAGRRFMRAELVVESEPDALLETLAHAVAPPNVFESP
jgi:hypothetical protein